MSTNQQNCCQDTPDVENDDKPKCPEDTGGPLIQLLEELDDIDETSREASLNKQSIGDNNGGRIELTKQPGQKL